MTTTDEQTIVDIEAGQAAAQEQLEQAEAYLARKRNELLEAQAAEGAAMDAIAAYAPEYNAVMAESRRPGEWVNMSDVGWRMSYPKGAAAAGRMQALEQARQTAASWVTRVNGGSNGQLFRAEQWVSQCRAEVDRWEGLRTQHEAAQASERAKRAQGWRPTLDQLAARLKAR